MAALTTSEHSGVIRTDVVSYLGATGPVDTAIVRDVVVNNLNHLTDVGGQELVNLQAVTAWSLGTPSTTVYRPLTALPPLPVPLRIRTDGSTYTVVVYLRASISAAGTADFRLALRPPSRAGARGVPMDPTLGATWTADTSTTSTTATDLGPFALRLPASVVAYAFDRGDASFAGSWPTEDGSGNDRTADILVATLEVWTKSSVITSLPTVHALEAREYIGKV